MIIKLANSAAKAGDRVINWLISGGACFSWTCLFIMAALIVVDITGRRLIGRSTQVATELSGYFLVVITFIAAAYTLKRERHISVSAVLEALPQKAKKWLTIFNSALALAFTVIVSWYTLKLPLQSLKVGTLSDTWLDTPMFIPQFITPIGLFILALATLSYTIRLFRTANKQKGHDESSPE